MSLFDSQSSIFPSLPHTGMYCVTYYILFFVTWKLDFSGYLISIKQALFKHLLCKRTILDTSWYITGASALKDLSVLIGRSSH